MRTAETGGGDEADGGTDVDDSNNLYSCSRESCKERSAERGEGEVSHHCFAVQGIPSSLTQCYVDALVQVAPLLKVLGEVKVNMSHEPPHIYTKIIWKSFCSQTSR